MMTEKQHDRTVVPKDLLAVGAVLCAGVVGLLWLLRERFFLINTTIAVAAAVLGIWSIVHRSKLVARTTSRNPLFWTYSFGLTAAALLSALIGIIFTSSAILGLLFWFTLGDMT